MRWIPKLFSWRMALLTGLLFAPLRCMNPAWSQPPASAPGPALADPAVTWALLTITP